MALIKCLECGREISDKAASCPKCGIPLTLQKNNLPQLAPASYSLNNLANNEYSFFQEGPINITNMRAIFRNKTFAMANITSVSMGEVPPKRIYGVIAIIIGIIFTIAFSGNDYLQLQFFGVLIVIAGIISLFLLKTEYSVKIGSASGENEGEVSKNKEFIEKIVTAMNNAIIKRG